MPLRFHSIRLPLVIGHTLFAALLLSFAWLAMLYSFRPGLEKIEAEAAASLADRFKLEIQTEIRSIQRLATDWSAWDDMYEFVETKTPKFIETNIVPSVFRNARLNALIIYDYSGKIIQAKTYDPASSQLKPLPQFEQPRIPDDFRFTLAIDKSGERSGIWSFNGQLSLFVAKAITDSNEEKTPNGIVVMATPLDETLLQSIGKRMRIDISMQPIRETTQYPLPDSLRIVPSSETDTDVFMTLADAAGAPRILIRLDMPRVLYGIGWKSVKHTVIFAICAVIILTLGLVGFTKYLVSIPLQKLSETVATLGETEHFEDLDRLPVERNDEIGVVARSVKKMHERILYLANHDALTQLPNRKVFRAAFDKVSARRERQTDQMGVLVIDLDGFKPINDTYGHPAGDRVLRVVAQRLRHAVRENDIVARTGGDEFAVLCGSIFSSKDMEVVAHKILQTTEMPIMLNSGQEVRIGMSIGGCCIGQNTTLDLALSTADAALYEVKATGKNAYRIGNAT